MAIYFGSPRKLPKPATLKGRVVVLDIAFASEAGGTDSFRKVTQAFIDGLGQRLVAWVDHHDSAEHARYRGDPRFVLHTKAEHGACPEIITPDLVERFGRYDTVVCHGDFDGLVSAAKWQRGGFEPYPGADADAYAVDTRIGQPSAVGERFDRAIRARPRDFQLFATIVEHLTDGLTDAALWGPIDEAARELDAIEATTREVAKRYVSLPPNVALVDATGLGTVDKTLLLLLGQEMQQVSIVVDRDSVTLAAAFDSGLNFLQMLGLSGGMPTRVSVARATLPAVWQALGVDPARADLALRPLLEHVRLGLAGASAAKPVELPPPGPRNTWGYSFGPGDGTSGGLTTDPSTKPSRTRS